MYQRQVQSVISREVVLPPEPDDNGTALLPLRAWGEVDQGR
jgi:hypothetical protein